jgi:chemotaxis methyl-accepting protein methylase
MRLTPGGINPMTVHQWSNDWITADDDVTGQQNIVLNPLRVRLEPDEMQQFRDDEAAHLAKDKSCHSGSFWEEWVLQETGFFRKRTFFEVGKAGIVR